MLVRLQFIIRVHGAFKGTALAWPREERSGAMLLTHEPLDSIGYGSEAVAIADLDRWLTQFPEIENVECVVLGSGDAP